jgi:hypothetical protein
MFKTNLEILILRGQGNNFIIYTISIDAIQGQGFQIK